MTRNVNLKLIRTDGGTQARAAMNSDAVTEYAAALADGDLPPVTLFLDGDGDHWLADGFHRHAAYLQAGRASIPATIHKGTQRDAILYSCGANSDHGLRRTTDDKQRAVGILLADPEWSKSSDRDIAKMCCVSHTMVSNQRKPKPADPPHQPKQGDGKVATPKPSGEKSGAPPEPDAEAVPGGPSVDPERPDASALAAEAHGDSDLEQMFDESQKEVAALRAQVDAASADDVKAEAMKWRRIAEVARSRQNELQQSVSDREADLKKLTAVLRRCGKAVGEDDPSKVAAAVEAVVRSAKAAA